MATEPTSSGFAIANKRADGSNPTTWEVFAADPKMREDFAAFMQFAARSSELGSDWLIKAFDWRNLRPGSTVVDVGGGRGHAMAALAAALPSLQFVVQDQADYADETMPAGVQFMVHDFFSPQPLRAEVYFSRKIFHDWSDKYCQRILTSLVPAMKPRSKLIINDIVLPDPSGRPDYVEHVARRLDISMMVMVNGKERTLSQWKSLVCGTETRLRFEAVSAPEGSAMSVLVFSFE